MPIFILQIDGQMTDPDGNGVFPEIIHGGDWRTGFIVNGKEYVVTDIDDKFGCVVEIDCEPIESLRYEVSVNGDGPHEQFVDIDDALAWLSERTGEPGGSVDWYGYDFNEPVAVRGYDESWLGNIRRVIVKESAAA